ncbi:alpha/beta fold hydrolase [Streptomyces sp. NPDC088732]|uniref:alpha/beta fold hydrolase n=1 Tax=Streptomyces sp. NPDC088732 TaxID=3365879 RepID=UPI0038075960
MRLALPRPLRTRRRLAAGVAALALLAGGGAVTLAAADGPAAVHRQDRVFSVPESPGSSRTVRIDASYFTSGSSAPRPAVLLAHGFGGSKADVRPQAEDLARHGYAVLTWSARGFGRSGGRIGLNSPDAEVADVSRLIDWLGKRPEVLRDGPDDPRVGVTGASYGGAISLLAAGHDRRVDAIAPAITWWNLSDALFPGGVFKKLWAGIFFSTGADGASCGFTAQLCAMYDRSAVSGREDDATRQLLERSSPSSVAARIKVPTLVVQGQNDSLFPLDQGDAIARAVEAGGAPVAVDWFSGGHDGGDQETDRVQGRITAWFDRYLKKDKGADTGPAFRVTRAGGVDTTDGRAIKRGADAPAYPGLGGTQTREIALTGGAQPVANPAGGNPPAISAVPGVGALSQLSDLGQGLSLSLDFPGQRAAFDSAPLRSPLRLTGAAHVRVDVRTDAPDGAVLFAKLYDVSPGGSESLPHQLVAPLRADGKGTVPVTLPAVDHEFAAGHRLRLVLSSTDLGYSSPALPATYRVSLPAGAALTVPVDPALTTDQGALPAWVWVLPLAAAALAAALLLTGRRRAGTVRQAPEPALADVPLEISGLSKRYKGAADRYAVRELSFRVERGQVLGLLGPNGAGKTTTMRMMMGLIRPDEGGIRVFGQAVRPGAPVLSRVGAFVEGAGFLPHLTGRANLELYWRATGRPAADAHVEEALEIAGLGEALERAVRTYSQGMRQRLAIAQAMLGLPDLLILDEPTNGLDPPQIREMRDVVRRYAAAGRTVIVSSHLLSEVEQSCTHLVVMDKGRLIAAGPVGEISGGGEALLVGAPGMPDDAREAVAAKLAALPGIAAAESVEDGLLVRPGTMTVPELLTELLRLDVPVERVGPHRRLEDAFLTLIGESA